VKTTYPTISSKTVQQGVALFIVLSFLVVLTGLGVFAARNSTLGERQARAQLDRNLATQAAEAALRDAERDLFQPAPAATAPCNRTTLNERPLSPDTLTDEFWGTQCTRGQCFFDAAYYKGTSGAQQAPWRIAAGGGVWNDNQTSKIGSCTFTGGIPIGTFTTGVPMQGVSRQPEYMMEFFRLPNFVNIVRITARGFGADPRTEVMLQSEVRAAFDKK
jgi:type IV pilus assembly protein PilX